MELRHLRYFVAVAEERHITRAAQRLGIQQPPLSLQIRQLEKELGAALFRRTARGVDLTPPGAAFLEEARAILARVRQAAAHVAEVADGRTGLLCLGVTTSAVLHPLVPQLIRAFRAAYPGVTLELQENNAAAVTEAVLAGTMTAAILRQPVHRAEGLAFLHLGEETMVVAVPAEEGPAPRPLRATDLTGKPLILVRRPGAPGMYADLLQLCRSAGFEPVVAAEVPHMLTAVSLVAAGLGIAVLPASMAEIGMQGVRYEALDEASLRAPVTLIYGDSAASPLLANFLATVRTLLRPREAA